jgi:hypothetical protein
VAARLVPVVPEWRKVWNKKSPIKSRACVILVPEFVPGFLYYGTAKRRGGRRNLLFLLELIDNNIREKREKKGIFEKRAVSKIFRGFLTRRAPLPCSPNSCAVLPDPPAFLLEHGTKPNFSLIFQGLTLFHENLLLEQGRNKAEKV